jgi:hypothetical protein
LVPEQTEFPFPVAIPVAAAPQPAEVPLVLGGYQILKELGRGGMGTVYLARQLSLDRKVALKVMKPDWAQNTTFMARFTREAHAAAQLAHHNIVQIYDVGSDRGFHYFSMEYVEGQSLGDLVQRQGPLSPEVAVGYVLQAARGLKYGHDRGMIHRDVKPDNLLLNDQGIVKVADLGLVKTPETTEPDRSPGAVPGTAGSQLTLAHATVGTPAYMAPEQARNSTQVDGRADVYALGCTLYVLVTGRPPFQGSTALEVISRHAFEPIVPPDALVKQVPKALSDIILKMVAKKPADRYADMGEVIRALESFLGVQGAGAFTPREEHAALLEQCVRRFSEVPAVRLRAQILLGFFLGCGGLVLLCALLRGWLLAAGLVNLAVLTPLSYLVVRGVARRTYLFLQAREWVLGSRRVYWLSGLVAGMLFLGILYLCGLLGWWLTWSVLAVALGLTFYLVVDRQVVEQQRGSVLEVEQLLRGLRLRGVDEEALRQFVCQYGGVHWEAFYEALFGYEAKRAARSRWAAGALGQSREKYAAWRDPIADWLAARLRARQEARERQVLQAAEPQGPEVQRVAADEAGDRAAQAPETKERDGPAASWHEGQPVPAVSDLLRLPPRPALVPVSPWRRRRRALAYFLEHATDRLLGPLPRLLVGLVLLAACGGWLYQNDLIPGQEIKQVAAEAVDRIDLPDFTPLEKFDWNKGTKPLSIPLVPEALTAIFSSFNTGAAGLLLVLSAILRGSRITLFGWLAAIVAFAGPWLPLPALGPLTPPQVSMAAAALLIVPGFVTLR